MVSDRIEIHLSPMGSEYGNGSIGYPVRDLQAALELVRQRRTPGQRAVVWVHPGTYRQTRTLVLTPDDSFTSFCAWEPGSETVFEGAVDITQWSTGSLRGTTVWFADAPADAGRSLFVDRERRPRPRYPLHGYLRIADQDGLDVNGDFVATLFDGADHFTFAAGDIPELIDEVNVEAIVPHYWLQERMPVTAIDRSSNTLTSNLRSIFALRDDSAHRFARFYLENVVESLGETPGEWYLDRGGVVTLDDEPSAVGRPRLLYVPRDGEEISTHRASIPCIDRFVLLDGDAAAERFVRELRFEGIGFRYADWSSAPSSRPPYGVREDPMLPADVDYAAGVQAASEVPAAIEFRGARSCAFIGGAVEHVGGYALQLADGSQGNLIAGSRFADLGAGAIKSGGSAAPEAATFNRANTVIDNEIVEGGRVYPHAVAVLFMHGSHNTIAHNHISDFFYTGISVGWVWDYEESPSHTNLIEANHIHNLGQGLLNDMGGIYLLGIAPGTRVRGNRIHDVVCANYGGWGIYLDEGSSHVVIEGNTVYDVSSQCFHQHYGRENILRHNVFAFGRQGQVSITRPERSTSFTLERNVIVGEDSAGFTGTPGPRDVRNFAVDSDLNLFWDYASRGNVTIAANGEKDDGQGWSITQQLNDDWLGSGHDVHSEIADPLFADVDARDFALSDDSPAFQIGFRTLEIEDAGPRSRISAPHPLAAPTLQFQADDAERS